MASKPLAQKIFLIRHAEKPEGRDLGVLPTGEEDAKSLSVRGWQRAGALVPHFANGQFVPQALFASHVSSLRPRLTLLPLEEKLGLEINLNFGKGEEEKLFAAVKASAGVVLICWQHDFMVAVANAILGESHTAPQLWPSDCFDVTWVFDLDEDSGRYRFGQIPQLLLGGDRTETL